MQSVKDLKERNQNMDTTTHTPRGNMKLMSLPQSLQLPNLSTRYDRVPRRYEETKPVIMQDFTHRKICDIGNSLYLRTIEKCNVVTENAIKEAEKTTWLQAEILKKDAVKDAIAKERLSHEKAVKKIHKIHEKFVKEEIQKVESHMQKITLEQVQAERKAGEARLEAAVKQTKETCYQELLNAVQEARAEERMLASQEADRVARMEASKLAKLLKEASEEKEKAIQTLTCEKDAERLQAVTGARQEEQQIASDKINELTTIFTNQISHLKQQVKGREQTVEALKDEIKRIEAEMAQLQTDLHESRLSFQEFIDKSVLFDPGQSEYVIPPTTRPLTTKK